MSDGKDNGSNFIVVGVDGSEPSKQALQWAARQAQLTGASLQAVLSWSVPVMAYGGPVVIPYEADFSQEAGGVLDRAISTTLGDDPKVKVSASVVEGRAAEVLVEAARGAALLVVGSRGHGAFTGMLLGSVSEYCVAHAPCPVVVVRDQS